MEYNFFKNLKSYVIVFKLLLMVGGSEDYNFFENLRFKVLTY